MNANVQAAAAVSYAAMQWVNLVRGERVVVLATAPDSNRVGVSVYQARKHVLYHELTRAQADRLIRQLEFVGFSRRPQSELE